MDRRGLQGLRPARVDLAGGPAARADQEVQACPAADLTCPAARPVPAGCHQDPAARPPSPAILDRPAADPAVLARWAGPAVVRVQADLVVAVAKAKHCVRRSGRSAAVNTDEMGVWA